MRKQTPETGSTFEAGHVTEIYTFNIYADLGSKQDKIQNFQSENQFASNMQHSKFDIWHIYGLEGN